MIENNSRSRQSVWQESGAKGRTGQFAVTNDRRLRIFLVATCPYFFVRGKPLRVHSNLLAFQDLGHLITVITYANGSEVDLPNINIFRTPHQFRMRNPQKVGPGVAKICSDLAILAVSSRILQRERHDIIIGTDIEGAAIAALLKRRFGLPVIIDVHGIFAELLQNNIPWANYLLGPVSFWIEKQVWRKADMLVCNWPSIEKYAKRIAPNIPSCTVFDVPPASVHEVASKPFPVSKEGRKWKQQLSRKRVVFYAGNFASYQNFNLASRGFSYALDHGLSDTVLLAVGDDYGPYLREAKALKIKDKVLFIGKRTPEETVDLMRLADICLTLIPCGGNAPSKIISYFLAGCPILACDSPAHRELLKDGKNALFCSNHPIDFAKKLLYLLKNEDARRRLARASIAYAEFFTLSTFRDKWRGILELLMALARHS